VDGCVLDVVCRARLRRTRGGRRRVAIPLAACKMIWKGSGWERGKQENCPLFCCRSLRACPPAFNNPSCARCLRPALHLCAGGRGGAARARAAASRARLRVAELLACHAVGVAEARQRPSKSKTLSQLLFISSPLHAQATNCCRDGGRVQAVRQARTKQRRRSDAARRWFRATS
jgi:hypothetical protein